MEQRQPSLAIWAHYCTCSPSRSLTWQCINSAVGQYAGPVSNTGQNFLCHSSGRRSAYQFGMLPHFTKGIYNANVVLVAMGDQPQGREPEHYPLTTGGPSPCQVPCSLTDWNVPCSRPWLLHYSCLTYQVNLLQWPYFIFQMCFTDPSSFICSEPPSTHLKNFRTGLEKLIQLLLKYFGSAVEHEQLQ